MTPEEFSIIIEKIRHFTDYIYLHVLGEPLLHPQFDEILRIAASANLFVNITTNGSLIEKRTTTLLKYPVRQINISLHDAEENIKTENWNSYLDKIFNFSDLASQKTYISFRLWNGGVETSADFNAFCIEKIAIKFNTSIIEINTSEFKKGLKLAENTFLQHAPRFDWPDGVSERNAKFKTCYALRDHIAILCDGTVVPCCIDADAALKLGNLFTDNLQDIIDSERATKIRTGFANNKIAEEHCKSCGFIVQ